MTRETRHIPTCLPRGIYFVSCSLLCFNVLFWFLSVCLCFLRGPLPSRLSKKEKKKGREKKGKEKKEKGKLKKEKGKLKKEKRKKKKEKRKRKKEKRKRNKAGYAGQDAPSMRISHLRK